jgi:hypothetical protein
MIAVKVSSFADVPRGHWQYDATVPREMNELIGGSPLCRMSDLRGIENRLGKRTPVVLIEVNRGAAVQGVFGCRAVRLRNDEMATIGLAGDPPSFPVENSEIDMGNKDVRVFWYLCCELSAILAEDSDFTLGPVNYPVLKNVAGQEHRNIVCRMVATGSEYVQPYFSVP